MSTMLAQVVESKKFLEDTKHDRHPDYERYVMTGFGFFLASYFLSITMVYTVGSVGIILPLALLGFGFGWAGERVIKEKKRFRKMKEGREKAEAKLNELWAEFLSHYDKDTESILRDEDRKPFEKELTYFKFLVGQGMKSRHIVIEDEKIVVCDGLGKVIKPMTSLGKEWTLKEDSEKPVEDLYREMRAV